MRSRRTWVSALRRGRDVIARTVHWPGILHLRRLAHRVEFAQGRPMNGYSGAYDDFASAQRAVPPGQPAGYDGEDMAGYYRDVLDHTNPDDYAALFWLRAPIAGARLVFDLGGHVGVSYFGFRRHLPLRDDAIWLVCDVPAVVRAGTELARERSAPALRFTSRQDDADGADVLMANGSLQYLPEGSLQALLGRLRSPPRHVVVQRTPLHESRSFVTIQATGHAFCPYTVAHRAAFVAGMEALGYEVVDSWKLRRSLEVPFEPWTRVEHYSGLYFRREQGRTPG